MKKKKEIEIPETKYIYQRYNGIITKYIVDEEYYIAVETGIANRKDTILLLGNVSESIINLVEVGDFVNGNIVTDKYLFAGEMPVVETNGDDTNCKCLCEKDIKEILTHEQYEQNCYRLEE